jgi:hypothetical protein
MCRQKRDILAFFRGEMGLNRDGCVYSRCVCTLCRYVGGQAQEVQARAAATTRQQQAEALRGSCLACRCIRQTLYRLYKAQKWRDKYKVQASACRRGALITGDA